ncbi:MAG TPA: putative toxin-antitoxin system toxin component, PIN family [Candidatus Acidoferrum sp.]|jgi:putative PIN family toxin of toxin-antitoxin system|nr:putative toxin-antitoxin system toxin component, PIN family [Candidatus Acidoferrum sp.]
MRAIRVVLDTNVIVSAHLNSEGYERSVLDLALSGKLRMFVSEAILREYESVLRRPKFRLNTLHVSRSLRLVRAAARVVAPYGQLNVAREPGDNRFLECAEAAKADYLVTGNKRHFPKQWRQTLIVNARELLEWTIPEMQ